MPDWLRNLYTSSARPAETTLVSSSSDDLPDWLRAMEELDVSQRSHEPTPATTQQREAQSIDTPVQSDAVSQTGAAPPITQELPDWLLQGEPSTTATTEQEFSTADDRRREDTALPPWLLDKDVPSSEVTQPVSVPTTQELPVWLRDDTPEPPKPAPDRPSNDSALPPWLVDQRPSWTDKPVQTSIAVEQPPTVWRLPSWLADPIPATADSPSSRPPTQLPAWLTEDLPEADAGAPGVTDTETAQPLPPWLRADDTASTEVMERHEASPAVTQALPSRLLEDAPEIHAEWSDIETAAVQASTPGAELPAWLLEDTTTPSQTDDGATDDTLPPWLQEDLSPEQTTQPSSDAAAQDDALPAWLREDDVKPVAISTGGATIYDTPEQQPPQLSERERSQPFDTPQHTPANNSTLPSWLQEETLAPSQAIPTQPSPRQTAQGRGATMETPVSHPADRRTVEPGAESERSTAPAAQTAAEDEAPTEGGSSRTLIYLLVALLVVLALIMLWLAAPGLGLS